MLWKRQVLDTAVLKGVGEEVRRRPDGGGLLGVAQEQGGKKQKKGAGGTVQATCLVSSVFNCL